MKLFKYRWGLYAVLCVLFSMSCNKESVEGDDLNADEEPLQFEVTTAKTTYTVGEQAVFNISGDPGILDFWSGEFGNDYDYKERRLLPGPDQILLEFRLREQYLDQNTGSILSIMVSTDFDGDRASFEEVDAAPWTDITDRFEIIGTAQGNTGKVDVTEFREEGKPMYVAFKYVYDPDLGNGLSTWPQITWMTVEAVTGEDILLLSGPLTSDFPKYGAATSLKNPIQSLNRYYDPDQGSNLLVIARNGNVTVDDVTYRNSDYTEEYFVAGPYPVGGTELEPDKPETLTSLSVPMISSHTHTYTQPGVYKVRFIGTDPALPEEVVVKEIEITVVAE